MFDFYLNIKKFNPPQIVTLIRSVVNIGKLGIEIFVEMSK